MGTESKLEIEELSTKIFDTGMLKYSLDADLPTFSWNPTTKEFHDIFIRLNFFK